MKALEELRTELKKDTHGRTYVQLARAAVIARLADELQSLVRQSAPVDPSHAQELGEVAARHGYEADSGSLTNWIDRKLNNLEIARTRSHRYGEWLQKIQATVSPETGPASFDQLPDLVARVAAERDHHDELASRRCNILQKINSLVSSPFAAFDQLPLAVAAVVRERKDLRKLASELQRPRAPSQPLNLYVVEYSFLRALVMAENEEQAFDYVVGKTDVGPPYTATRVDMTKPGVLRR